MFGRKNEKIKVNPEAVDTLIGKGTEIKGTVKATGVLRIEGKVEGELESTGDIIVAETGVVNAQLKARNAVIAGEVNGNIFLSGKLEIKSSGKVLGDLRVEGIIVEDGAFFQGRCEMDRTKEDES
ncbi:protein CcmA, bactofilin family [Caldanaerovirga acetigignens]|uniref:Protein CcmA, bactofilin family n=1 Tax=Caldanaerovirga acetigignens TaxID=447595 RepID=A0A1M7GP73_9FIRM|nr:polymer-forming cytoskeletal protein [Caldanaerovirga acetigignens]SHM17975.1 protein CcmA, bactofilin family [Caldanaerovirga acetigignens]